MPTTADDAIHVNVQENFSQAWGTWMEGLEATLNEVEECLDQANEMKEICTDEWCEATDSLLDQLNTVLFSIHEPRWTSEEDSQRIKDLRTRARKLYNEFEEIVEEA